MALKRNGRDVFSNNPGRFVGTQSLQSGNFIKGGLRNRNVGGLNQTFSAYPNGTLSSNAFVLPQKAGSISSYTRSRASLSKNSSALIPAMPMIASSSFSMNATPAQLDQIVKLIAAGVMSLTGSSSIAAAVSAAAAGSVSLSGNAQLGGIIPIYANSSTTATGNAVLTALAFMEASAGGPTPLSPEGLANAILDALLADHTDPGSVGEALNSIGAAGNPWSADLSSNNVSGTFGERIQKLLTTNKFIGLK